MKFSNEHDEYLYEGSVVSGVVTGDGDVEAPTGWFAPITLQAQGPFEADPGEQAALAHYGTPYLILHESNEGFVTVLPFDDEVKRNDRVNDLARAYALYEAKITDAEAREAIDGYLQAALHTALGGEGEPLPIESTWSGEAQTTIANEVMDFLAAEHENIREFLTVTGFPMLQIGIDFSLTRNRHGAGFWDRGAGDVGQALTDAAHVYGEQHVYVDSNGELAVQ